LREDILDIQNAIIRVSDITEERALQREIIKNEKLAALGLLVSGIAHEINNPKQLPSASIYPSSRISSWR